MTTATATLRKLPPARSARNARTHPRTDRPRMPEPRKTATNTAELQRDLEQRVTRLETGVTTLTKTIDDYVQASREFSKEHSEWQHRIEHRLTHATRPGWGIVGFVLPLVVVAATWVASYVGSISREHKAADQRISERLGAEIRFSTKERQEVKAIQKDFREWQIEQAAHTARLEERMRIHRIKAGAASPEN